MLIQSSALVAAVGTVVLGTAALPAAAESGTVPPPQAPDHHRVVSETDVDARALLAAVEHCIQISNGKYATDRGKAANIPVCGHEGAVSWEADMDIDCDGRRTAECNLDADPSYQEATAFTQSDGRYLNAEKLPFVVVPVPSTIWDYRASGIRGGSAAAMIYKDRILYGVVGDAGPSGIIGEASYAAAEALGIDPDPATGGVASGVTYIVFTDSKVSPIESHAAATTLGAGLAKALVERAGVTGAAGGTGTGETAPGAGSSTTGAGEAGTAATGTGTADVPGSTSVARASTGSAEAGAATAAGTTGSAGEGEGAAAGATAQAGKPDGVA